MEEVDHEGEITTDGEKLNKSKTKANDWAEDAKLENFSEGKLRLYYALFKLYDHRKQIHNHL